MNEIAAWIAGFVVAEGTFGRIIEPPRFRFAVGLGAVDEATCIRLQVFFGVGSLVRSARRKAHYDDEVAFVVQSLSHLVNTIVPFMDDHLPPSYKRKQYIEWRERLVDYWENGAKRRRLCTEEGCDKPQRALGVCRHHYYVKCGR